MKGFKIDKNGDVVFSDGQIDMVSGTELERQSMQTVLKTNKGEDIFNSDEGIDFYQILGKSVTEDKVKTQIQSGINQVNTEFSTDYAIEDFTYSVSGRKSTSAFSARKSNGEAAEVTVEQE